MSGFWEKLKAWAASKGGWVHIIAAIYASLILAYGAVPAFHQLVMDVWAHLPHWASELVVALTGLAAWYKSTSKD